MRKKRTKADKDYYSILGINSSATQEEIKSAYRNKVKEIHPDLFQHTREKLAATQKLQALNEAYEILSNLIERKGYDVVQSHDMPPTGETENKHFDFPDWLYEWGGLLFKIIWLGIVLWIFFSTTSDCLPLAETIEGKLGCVLKGMFMGLSLGMAILFGTGMFFMMAIFAVGLLVIMPWIFYEDYLSKVWERIKENPTSFRLEFKNKLIAACFGLGIIYVLWIVLHVPININFDWLLGFLPKAFQGIIKFIIESLLTLLSMLGIYLFALVGFGLIALTSNLGLNLILLVIYWIWSPWILRKTHSLIVKAES